ncbi:hypothetical protein FM125_10800 [Micrococcus lylae]|uniref:Uncharacterized protein n=1 Tax=Micrococcus lylae TaxID=1273 RepID=A0A1R4JUJ7_9MICC|nr:hypothetical protein FM125_10800 [Micrococcus lylae]
MDLLGRGCAGTGTIRYKADRRILPRVYRLRHLAGDAATGGRRTGVPPVALCARPCEAADASSAGAVRTRASS